MKKILVSFYKIPKKIRKHIGFLINYMVLSSGIIVTWEHFFPARHIIVSLFLLFSSFLAIIFVIKQSYVSTEFTITPDIEKAYEKLNNHETEMIEIFMTLAKETAQREFITNQLYDQQHYMLELIDKLPAYIAVKNADGKYQIVNRQFAALAGCEPRELIGKTVLETAFDKRGQYHDSDKCILNNGKLEIVKETIQDIYGNEITIMKFKKPFRNGVLIFGIDTEYICK